MKCRIIGTGLLLSALLYLLCLYSYDPSDPSWFLVDTSRETVHNWLGSGGATVASFSVQYLGNWAPVLCGVLLMSSGLLCFLFPLLHPCAPASRPSPALEEPESPVDSSPFPSASGMERLALDRSPARSGRLIDREELFRNSQRWIASRKKR